MLNFCWIPRVDDEGTRFCDDSSKEIDGLLWSKDLGFHDHGQFSMAVIQANSTLEDQSQLKSGPLNLSPSDPSATFVGVYDGHGGPDASRFVNDHLFCNIKRFASAHQGISEDVIRQAFAATEEAFLTLVGKTWLVKPEMASSGSCCLVGIIANGHLHIANLGDSRVVLGRAEKGSKDIKAIQLSTDHNANFESVRKELREAHPQDPNIVQLKHRVWRVKGLIKVSRSVGDAYLKKSEFNRAPLLPKFRLNKPFHEPILSSKPTISAHKICPEDQFLIFASDGLWDHLSNQRAVDIVCSYPRKGIARRLVKAALQEAAKKREIRYSDLKFIERGVRRHFHDDMTVIVVFLDAHSVNEGFLDTSFSIRGGEGLPAPAKISN